MSKKELIEVLKEQDIRPNTISFYVDESGDGEAEPYFGTCDLSGERGSVAPCMALNSKDEIVRFDAGEWLIAGHLGKLAGAF